MVIQGQAGIQSPNSESTNSRRKGWVKMRKTLAFLTSILIIAVSIPCVSFASSSIVAYPADGQILNESPDKAILSIDEGYDTVVFIDGEEVSAFTTVGNDEVSLSYPTTVGEHKLSVVAQKNNDVLSQDVNFIISKTINNENLYSSFTDGNHGSVKPQDGLVTPGTDADGKTIYIRRTDMIGKDGDEKGATGFLMEHELANPVSGYENKSVFFYVSTTNYNWSGTVEIEYDLKLFQKGFFDIEIYNGGYGRLIGKNFVQNSGVILGTDVQYPVNEWMHVKHVLNISQKTESLYIDNVPVVENKSNSVISGLKQVKFQFFLSGTGGGQGFAIDNVRMSELIDCKGFDEVSYKNSEEEYHSASNAVIKSEADTVKLSGITGIEAGDVSNKLTIESDVLLPKVKSAAADNDGSVTIIFEKSLPEAADFTVYVQCKTADKQEYTIQKSIRCASYEFGIKDVTVNSGAVPCITANQLEPGSELDINFILGNTSDTQKDAHLIVAVYDGCYLTGLEVKKVTLSAHADNQIESIKCTLSSRKGAYTVECYLMDNFTSGIALSKVWGLK